MRQFTSITRSSTYYAFRFRFCLSLMQSTIILISRNCNSFNIVCVFQLNLVFPLRARILLKYFIALELFLFSSNDDIALFWLL